jgi:hypothetical protein
VALREREGERRREEGGREGGRRESQRESERVRERERESERVRERERETCAKDIQNVCQIHRFTADLLDFHDGFAESFHQFVERRKSA